MASRRVSQTTFFSSATVSPMKLNLELPFLGVTLPCVMNKISHAPGYSSLLNLSMESVSTATRAILFQLQPLGVILFVLGSGICPLPTLSTGKANNNPSFSLLRHNLLYDASKSTSPYRFTTFPDSKSQSLLQSHRINQLNGHFYIITRHDHLHPFR